jgi:hypothetical protein
MANTVMCAVGEWIDDIGSVVSMIFGWPVKVVVRYSGYLIYFIMLRLMI